MTVTLTVDSKYLLVIRCRSITYNHTQLVFIMNSLSSHSFLIFLRMPTGKGSHKHPTAGPNGELSLDADVSLVPTTDLDLDADLPDLDSSGSGTGEWEELKKLITY